MLALYIIGGILLFFFLVGLIRVEVVLSYAEEFGLVLSIAGFPLSLIPGKKKKIKLRDYSPKAIAKRKLKEQKKAEKKAAKKKKKKEADQKKKAEKKKEKDEDKLSLLEIIDIGTAVLKVFVKRFAKHLRIRIARLHFGVASGDAATTAILYGAVSQGACYMAALLDGCGTLRYPAKSDVQIYADYLSEKPVIDMEIGISMLVCQLFDIIWRVIGTAIKKFFKILFAKNKK